MLARTVAHVQNCECPGGSAAPGGDFPAHRPYPRSFSRTRTAGSFRSAERSVRRTCGSGTTWRRLLCAPAGPSGRTGPCSGQIVHANCVPLS
ncbi:hypothetical protein Ciccas_011014 [Cichlidogyrus casuarinus]|uniref:Uncharacterized protein n=1 Tax=Cichlidogyrus casuarinus TaxID=1844966 RepID=A0ABD2PSH8_9PLAT